MEKRLGTEICCITIRVITGDYCSKSDSKGEDRGSGTVVCVACRRKDSESDRSCQQEEAKRNYLGFVTVVISIIIIVLL